MYDWANSVYSLVITSSIFPAYYEGVTSGKKIAFLGRVEIKKGLCNSSAIWVH